MSWKRVLVVLGCFVALSACGDDAAEPTDGTEPDAGDSSIEVSAADFSFSPSTIEVEAGAPVEITFTNNGQSDHTFTIEGLVDLDAKPGEEVTGEFTAPDSNTEFHCEIHPDRMTGELVVDGSASGGSGGSGGTDQDLDY